MKKTKNIIVAFIILTVFIGTNSFSFAQGYTPLTPIPGTTTGNCAVDSSGNLIDPDSCKVPITDYIPNIFTLLIGLAGVLAVLMIVIGGVQYLSTDAIGGKSEAKEKITNAILGLLLAIGAYIILYTINPNALTFNLTGVTYQAPPGVKPPAQPVTDTCPGYNGPQPCSCPTCISIKNNKNSQGFGVTVSAVNDGAVPGLANSLLQLNEKLTSCSAVQGTCSPVYGFTWRVTEAYKPSRPHQSSCHYNGTCVDANIYWNGNPSINQRAQYIKRFLQEASASGLRAVYEVATDAERNALIQAGASFGGTGSVLWVRGSNCGNAGQPACISAPHFSVYLN